MFGFPLSGIRNTMRLTLIAAPLALIPACQEDAAVGTVPQLPLPTLPPDPVPAWLDANVHPFDGSHFSLPHTELEFLRDIVGDARVVSLGEGTHGTRDFFEMKARILRFLVEEMGFNTFAIEATWPESRRLDHYVRTGEGDPRVLLSGLYFWTWNTESVLEMIEWMRAHNEAGGDVGFHGFDMQYPGMALHNVREYLDRVDPENFDKVAAQLNCLATHANGPDGFGGGYAQRSAAYHNTCGRSMEQTRDFLLERRQEHEAVAGADSFYVALQSLRVAFQYHLRCAEGGNRDEFMAENTVWISERIGPEGRMVLWAHNGHVATRPYAQGSYLREAFRDDMVVVAFSHETGKFSAVDLRPNARRGYGPHDLEPPPTGSFESRFATARFPRFVLDLRGLDTRRAETRWLGARRLFRSIGCCLSPNYGTWFDTNLSESYDVIIHFEATGPTTILPFRYPDSW